MHGKKETITTNLNRTLSPVWGRVIEIDVYVGDEINVGDRLFVVESMKTEFEIVSDIDGKVGKICVNKGDFIYEEDCLLISNMDDIDLSFNEDLLYDLVREILSGNMFYIICDDEFKEVTENFERNLKSNNIKSQFLSGNVEEFAGNISNDSCLLVISKSGQNDVIREIIKIARLNHVEVYGIFSDFRHGLAILADKRIILKDYFDIQLEKIFDYVVQSLKDGPKKIDKKTPKIPKIPKTQKGNVRSPFQGIVIDIKVDIGDEVKQDDVLCVMEAMKMENEMVSEITGVVDKIFIEPGDYVNRNEIIMNII
jgi:biotin carboxyl carrier protein